MRASQLFTGPNGHFRDAQTAVIQPIYTHLSEEIINGQELLATITTVIIAANA